MNTFKKYPKLNLLFFLRISIIVLVGFTGHYLTSNISEAFNSIESISDLKTNPNTTPKEFQEKIKRQADFHEFKNDILHSIYYLLILVFIGSQLLALLKNKTDKENKRLDNLENQH